ncbi:MAG: GNAT family N-acetyltransferase [Anaerolineales bacterium]|jgi:ribosomal protein S18 acetylase RimI-like enzyme
MKVEKLAAADRDRLRTLLDEQSPRDALACYYALYHPAARTGLYIISDPPGRPEALLVKARTGQDLFRPLISLRAPGPVPASSLLQAALAAGESAYFSMPASLTSLLPATLEIQQRSTLQIFQLEARSFQPVVNIFVTRSKSPDGLTRYEVRQAGRLLAAAGLNWRSRRFAEVFVHTEPETRERGYGRSVVSGLCAELLSEGLTPLYHVEPDNEASVRLAQGVGFRDSGEREFACVACRASAAPTATGSPSQREEALD